MNRIYKVIWSKVKNCYIVVSEIAKSHSKPISTKLNSGKTVAAVLAALALVSVSGVALVQAVDVKLGDNAGTSNYVGQVGSIAIGNNSYVKIWAVRRKACFLLARRIRPSGQPVFQSVKMPMHVLAALCSVITNM